MAGTFHKTLIFSSMIAFSQKPDATFLAHTSLEAIRFVLQQIRDVFTVSFHVYICWLDA